MDYQYAPKIKIFFWLVKKNRILTKVNLLKKGWQGDTNVCFVIQLKPLNLFVSCPFVSQIWQWIANFNFTGTTLDDL
jgi:zinc-binding in reverse transcriptase